MARFEVSVLGLGSIQYVKAGRYYWGDPTVIFFESEQEGNNQVVAEFMSNSVISVVKIEEEQ